MHNFRIQFAELIVRLAKRIMPPDYMLEGERAAGMTVIEGIGMQAEEVGIRWTEDDKVTLFDMMVYWKQGHQ